MANFRFHGPSSPNHPTAKPRAFPRHILPLRCGGFHRALRVYIFNATESKLHIRGSSPAHAPHRRPNRRYKQRPTSEPWPGVTRQSNNNNPNESAGARSRTPPPGTPGGFVFGGWVGGGEDRDGVERPPSPLRSRFSVGGVGPAGRPDLPSPRARLVAPSPRGSRGGGEGEGRPGRRGSVTWCWWRLPSHATPGSGGGGGGGYSRCSHVRPAGAPSPHTGRRGPSRSARIRARGSGAAAQAAPPLRPPGKPLRTPPPRRKPWAWITPTPSVPALAPSPELPKSPSERRGHSRASLPSLSLRTL